MTDRTLIKNHFSPKLPPSPPELTTSIHKTAQGVQTHSLSIGQSHDQHNFDLGQDVDSVDAAKEQLNAVQNILATYSTKQQEPTTTPFKLISPQNLIKKFQARNNESANRRRNIDLVVESHQKNLKARFQDSALISGVAIMKTPNHHRSNTVKMKTFTPSLKTGQQPRPFFFHEKKQNLVTPDLLQAKKIVASPPARVATQEQIRNSTENSMRLHSVKNEKTSTGKGSKQQARGDSKNLPLRLDLLNEPASKMHLRAITSEITERAREGNRTPLRKRGSTNRESSIQSKQGGVNTIKGMETFRYNPEQSQATDRETIGNQSLVGSKFIDRKYSVQKRIATKYSPPGGGRNHHPVMGYTVHKVYPQNELMSQSPLLPRPKMSPRDQHEEVHRSKLSTWQKLKYKHLEKFKEFQAINERQNYEMMISSTNAINRNIQQQSLHSSLAAMNPPAAAGAAQPFASTMMFSPEELMEFQQQYEDYLQVMQSKQVFTPNSVSPKNSTKREKEDSTLVDKSVQSKQDKSSENKEQEGEKKSPQKYNFVFQDQINQEKARKALTAFVLSESQGKAPNVTSQRNVESVAVDKETVMMSADISNKGNNFTRTRTLSMMSDSKKQIKPHDRNAKEVTIESISKARGAVEHFHDEKTLSLDKRVKLEHGEHGGSSSIETPNNNQKANLYATIQSKSVTQEFKGSKKQRTMDQQPKFKSNHMDSQQEPAIVTIGRGAAIHGSTQLTQTAVESPSVPYSEHQKDLKNFTKAIISQESIIQTKDGEASSPHNERNPESMIQGINDKLDVEFEPTRVDIRVSAHDDTSEEVHHVDSELQSQQKPRIRHTFNSEIEHGERIYIKPQIHLTKNSQASSKNMNDKIGASNTVDVSNNNNLRINQNFHGTTSLHEIADGQSLSAGETTTNLQPQYFNSSNHPNPFAHHKEGHYPKIYAQYSPQKGHIGHRKVSLGIQVANEGSMIKGFQNIQNVSNSNSMNLYDVNESTENLTEYTYPGGFEFSPTYHVPYLAQGKNFITTLNQPSPREEYSFPPPIVQPKSHVAPLGSLPQDPVYIQALWTMKNLGFSVTPEATGSPVASSSKKQPRFHPQEIRNFNRLLLRELNKKPTTPFQPKSSSRNQEKRTSTLLGGETDRLNTFEGVNFDGPPATADTRFAKEQFSDMPVMTARSKYHQSVVEQSPKRNFERASQSPQTYRSTIQDTWRQSQFTSTQRDYFGGSIGTTAKCSPRSQQRRQMRNKKSQILKIFMDQHKYLQDPMKLKPWPTRATPTGAQTKGLLLPDWKECLMTESLIKQGVPRRKVNFSSIDPNFTNRPNYDHSKAKLLQNDFERVDAVLVSGNRRPQRKNRTPMPFRNFQQIFTNEAISNMPEGGGGGKRRLAAKLRGKPLDINVNQIVK